MPESVKGLVTIAMAFESIDKGRKVEAALNLTIPPSLRASGYFGDPLDAKVEPNLS